MPFGNAEGETKTGDPESASWPGVTVVTLHRPSQLLKSPYLGGGPTFRDQSCTVQ